MSSSVVWWRDEGVALGLAAAVCYGLSGVFSKGAVEKGMSTGMYIFFWGSGIAVCGLAYSLAFEQEMKLTREGVIQTLANSVCLALGSVVVFIALKGGTPIAVLSPLYNASCIVTVLLGALFLGERVRWPLLLVACMLLLGSIAIVSISTENGGGSDTP